MSKGSNFEALVYIAKVSVSVKKDITNLSDSLFSALTIENIAIVVSVAVLICSVPISRYFGNDSLKTLIIFAAILPVCQNSISLLQIMFIAIGKAKQIAIRNLIVSILKLIAVTISCYIFNNISVVFLCQLLTDVIQIIYFVLVLHKNNCRINILELDKTLIKEILFYCILSSTISYIKSLSCGLMRR
jgi:hypothetical protein